MINSGVVAGVDLFDSSIAQTVGDMRIQYYPVDEKFQPIFNVADGTYNAAAKVTFILNVSFFHR